MKPTAEQIRLWEDSRRKRNWKGWGPYLAERQWATVREDYKECYFYLDSTPTHSYLRALYKYPQAEFPYSRLIEENRRRGLGQPEFELIDSGAFDEDRYFDVFAEYAKASPNDLLIRITVTNRGPEPARLHLLPTLWFRNTWAWGDVHEERTEKPLLRLDRRGWIVAQHESLGEFHLALENRAVCV